MKLWWSRISASHQKYFHYTLYVNSLPNISNFDWRKEIKRTLVYTTQVDTAFWAFWLAGLRWIASTIHLRANEEKQNGFPFRFGYRGASFIDKRCGCSKNYNNITSIDHVRLKSYVLLRLTSFDYLTYHVYHCEISTFYCGHLLQYC